MAKKKRAPIKQLLEAGRVAKELLIKRGIQLPDEQSAIQRIRNMDGAPMLPGVPEHIPREKTIDEARKVLHRLTREWERLNKDNTVAMMNMSEFSKFVVAFIRDKEKEITFQIGETIRSKKYDIKFLFKKDALKGLRQLFVESFAISFIAKSNTDVATYFEWFNDWITKIDQVAWGSRYDSQGKKLPKGYGLEKNTNRK
jgi:hypothetical protein